MRVCIRMPICLLQAREIALMLVVMATVVGALAGALAEPLLAAVASRPVSQSGLPCENGEDDEIPRAALTRSASALPSDVRPLSRHGAVTQPSPFHSRRHTATRFCCSVLPPCDHFRNGLGTPFRC